MLGCVLSQSKPSELYILSCGKSLGLRPRLFPQLRFHQDKDVLIYTFDVTLARCFSL